MNNNELESSEDLFKEESVSLVKITTFEFSRLHRNKICVEPLAMHVFEAFLEGSFRKR